MAAEKHLIDAKGKFVLNAGDITGHIMCVENGYATVFDRFAKKICTFSLLDAPTVDAVEVVRCKDCFADGCCSVQIDLDMGGEGYCPKGKKEK